MDFEVPEFREGQVPTARDLNLLVRLVNAANRMEFDEGFEVSDDATGRTVSVPPCPGMWIELTGGGTAGKYAWKEIIHVEEDDFVDGYASGTASVDYAQAIPPVTDLDTSPGVTRVWAMREQSSNELVFQADNCP